VSIFPALPARQGPQKPLLFHLLWRAGRPPNSWRKSGWQGERATLSLAGNWPGLRNEEVGFDFPGYYLLRNWMRWKMSAAGAHGPSRGPRPKQKPR